MDGASVEQVQVGVALPGGLLRSAVAASLGALDAVAGCTTAAGLDGVAGCDVVVVDIDLCPPPTTQQVLAAAVGPDWARSTVVVFGRDDRRWMELVRFRCVAFPAEDDVDVLGGIVTALAADRVPAVAPTLAQLLIDRQRNREPYADLGQVTADELTVLRLLCGGTVTAQIADKLGVSTATVTRTVRLWRSRLNASTNEEMAVEAVRWGLVDGVDGVDWSGPGR